MSGSIPQGPRGEVITAANGEQYFIIGRSRIKITEYFPSYGKPIDELITELITNKRKSSRNGIKKLKIPHICDILIMLGSVSQVWGLFLEGG